MFQKSGTWNILEIRKKINCKWTQKKIEDHPTGETLIHVLRFLLEKVRGGSKVRREHQLVHRTITDISVTLIYWIQRTRFPRPFHNEVSKLLEWVQRKEKRYLRVLLSRSAGAPGDRRRVEKSRRHKAVSTRNDCRRTADRSLPSHRVCGLSEEPQGEKSTVRVINCSCW